MTWKTVLTLLMFSAAAVGCSHEGDRLSGDDLPPGHPDAAPAAGATQPAGELPPGHPPMGGMGGGQTPMGELPPGHPPMGGTGMGGMGGMGHGTGAPSPGLTEEEAARLLARLPVKWAAPEGWTAQPPSNGMRAAQFVVAEGVECVLYGGIGGTDDENIARWVNFFEQADGSSSEEAAKITQSDHAGVEIKRVEVTGTFSGQMMPGQKEPENREQMALLGACITSPEGHKFHAKMQGPADVVEAARPVFDAWLESFRPQTPAK